MIHQKRKPTKHEHNKGQQVKTSQRLQPVFIIEGQATKTGYPRETALNHSASGKRTKPCLASGNVTTSRHIPQAWTARRCRPHRRRPVRPPGPGPGQKVGSHAGPPDSPGIHGCADLAAFAPFGPIIARSMPTFQRRLQEATVTHGGRRLFLASGSQPQHRTQIIHDGFTHARSQPVLPVLIHHRPWGGRSCGITLLGAGPHDPPQAVRHVAQAVFPLGSLFRHHSQRRGHMAHSSSLTSLGMGFCSSLQVF